MSTVPRELRDSVVRRLESALAERDRKLGSLNRDVSGLRGMLGQLEAEIVHQRELGRRIARELESAEEDVRRERSAALERLERLQERAEAQHGRLVGEIEAAERRHREEWHALDRRIDELAAQREARERLIRDAGRAAALRAADLLAALDRNEVEALDLVGSLASARHLLDGAQALAADPDALPAETLAAGRGAEESALAVAGRLEQRRAMLERLGEELRAAADWLSSLLDGEATDELQDQRELVERLLHPERALMAEMIDRHLLRSANQLRHWNGHAVLGHRLAEVRDLLAGEILAARNVLAGAAEHDRERYRLDHLWGDLEIRFGRIRYEPGRVEGTWADPTDRKSAYLYFLESRAGELQVILPWADPLSVHHEGRVTGNYPLAVEPSAEARRVGDLRARWQELALRLANPNWNPDLYREETLS